MKFFSLLLLLTLSLYSITLNPSLVLEKSQLLDKQGKVYFGEQLFHGHFTNRAQFQQNPDYRLKVGDVISLKIWGAYNFQGELTIDEQGNIFIPQVGTANLLGLSNRQLQPQLEASIKEVFPDKVNLYAYVRFFQPLSVFVSGSVNKVGLYDGFSTDSVLQFIDKAGGIIKGEGSYREIVILRHKRVVKKIDLYTFLLQGSVPHFRFRQGDVILIKPLKYLIDVEGDVRRPYMFELKHARSSVKEILPYVLPKEGVNRFIITKLSQGKEVSHAYPLKDAKRVYLHKGERITFSSDHYIQSANIVIEGEHIGASHLSVPKGTSLYDVLKTLPFSPLSSIENIQLFRQSVAMVQKNLLLTKLKALEARALTTDSATPEEATIRSKESEMILKFIARAKEIQPKGQVILSKEEDLRRITLEEGDRIYIPRKSHIVVVQGEVSIPNAITVKKGFRIDDYIQMCGGFSDRANKEKVLLVKANGRVISYKANSGLHRSPLVEAGDSILVLSKTDSKNLLLTKDITQILYQIAVGASVVINAF